MANARNDLLDRLAYLALRAASMLLHCLPVETGLAGARFVGDCLYRFDRRHRQRAIAVLQRCFPQLSHAQAARIARRSFQQLAMFVVDVLFTTRLVRIDTYARHVELVNFHDVLEMLIRRRSGLIMLTAHYGNFEILGYVLATLGFATSSVARPLDNPYISRWLFGVREKHGQKLIVKAGAAAEVSQVLAEGGVVGFVADQNAGPKGLFVDFFGRPASTYKSIGLLAMEYNVPVVIGYARRIGEGFRFEMGTQDIIRPEDWQNQSDPLRYITQRYTRAIEDFVRADPSQYWWTHRRWKTRPRGETPLEYD